MHGILRSSLALLYGTLLGVAHGTPSSTAASSSPTSSQSGCPSPIIIKNGGFESGKIAPWTLAGNTNPTVKQRIVSPGYKNSKHALRVDFVPANITEYTLTQSTTGQECFGYYYNISYSWNWLKYTGPEGNGANGASYCAFGVGTGYTAPVGTGPAHYGSRTPGWHHHSYIARDVYSHCRPAVASYVVDVTCVGENFTTVLPAFTMLLDNFSIKNAPGDPENPPPPHNSC